MKKIFTIFAALMTAVVLFAQTPEHLYILGNIEGVGWEPAGSAEMTKNGDVFTGEYTFTSGTSYFAFTTVQGSWDEVNVNRWGAPHLVNDAAPVALIPHTTTPEPTATIDQGTYTITVNWANMTVSAHHDVAPVEIAGPALWPANVLLATRPAQTRILSMNNSLIHYENEWQDDMFNQMATAMGADAQWTAHTNLGKTLDYHYDEGEGLTEGGTPSARMLVHRNAYSHIILQEQTAKPRTNLAGFRASIEKWVNYIRTSSANPSAEIVVPVNWAYNSDMTNFTGFNTEFAANYAAVAQEFGVTITPVGLAYQMCYDAEGTAGLNTWFKDDRHPTQKATYMACCMEYGIIMGVDPLTITWKPGTITDAEAASMRQYAHNAIQAWNQTVDQVAGTVRYEVHMLDANGLSTGKVEGTNFAANGGTMAANVFTKGTTDGQYTATASYDGNNLTANIVIAQPQMVVVELPAIAVNATNNTVSENFDTMDYPAADATVGEKGVYGQASNLPVAWRVERNQVGPRTIGAYADASVSAQYQGGQNLPSNASNGTWNLGMNGSADRAVGGMTTSVANGARTINVMTHLTNDGTVNFDTIRIAYDIEKYREGSNANLFYVKLFTSTNGAAWTEAGADFTWLNPAGTGQTGFETVPGFTQHVEGNLAYHFTAGTDLYLCWSISTSTGDNCAQAPCLAIDNVNIEFVEAEAPASNYHIYADDQTGWASLALYAWGDAELYGKWPGVYPVGTEVVDGVTYKVFPYDITAAGSYNLIFNNGNNGSQAPDFNANEARDYYLVVKATGVTEVGDEPVIPEPDYAAIELTAAAANYAQNFDALPYPAADATVISGFNGAYGLGSTLPQGWRAERNEVGPRTIGAYANASDTLQYQGGVSLPSNAKNGTWNLGMNGSADRAVGGMTTGAAGGARTVNIMAFVKNTEEAREITKLDIKYDIEKYRDGSNANEFYVKLFTSVNGADWTAAEGESFTFINPKGDAQTGFAEVPAATTPAEGTLEMTIPAGGYIHLCWSICTSAGTDCQAAPCLAIDNVEIQATYADILNALENTEANNVKKFVRDGQVLIERNGAIYNTLGTRIR